MKNNNQAYFYMLKEIMSSEYKDYSAETNLLFSMLISNAKTASAMCVKAIPSISKASAVWGAPRRTC